MNALYITPAGRDDPSLPPLEEVFPDLEWTLVTPEEVQRHESADLVVVSPQTKDEVNLFRSLRGLGDAQLLFLENGSDRKRLESWIAMTPGVSARAEVRDASDQAATISSVRKMIETVESRRQLRTTLDRMNLRLSESFDPAQMKKMALSDEYLAAILSSAADAILSLDESGLITSANRSAEMMFGTARNELIRGRFEQFLAVADREQFREFIAAADLERSERLRLRFARPDGSLKAADVTFSWFGGTGRVPRSISVMARDVSREEREAAEKKILVDASAVLFSSLEMRESLEQLLKLLVEEWVDICMVDLERGGTLQRVSAFARDGRSLQGCFPYGSLPKEKDGHPACEALERMKPVTLRKIDDEHLDRFAMEEADRESLCSREARSMIIAPLVVHGRSIGVMTVISIRRELDEIDVRLSSELAQRLAIAFDNARLYEEALEASRLKDEFLATLSHELRTPMTAILGWVRMLDLGDLDEETYREAMTTIRRSAKAQASLIDDILDVSRITLGKLRLDVNQIDPAELVRLAVETTAAAAEAKRINLEIQIEPDTPMIRGDAARLQQVIWNLVSNAVKFTPKRGEIKVACDTHDSWVRIRVSDNGEGIPFTDVPYVFDRFRQVDSSSTRSHGGLGLGLSIVKQIVELHGGEVAAESAGIGKGAVFTVLLPIASVAEQLVAEEGERKVPSEDEGMALYSLEGQSILVIDDHDDARRLVETVLDQAGAKVASAASAREAVGLINENEFSVIVSDIAMPDEDGFRLLQRIRELEAHRKRSLCVVALTAFGGGAAEERMREAGFDAYLRKPVDPVALTRTIHDLLQLDRNVPPRSLG